MEMATKEDHTRWSAFLIVNHTPVQSLNIFIYSAYLPRSFVSRIRALDAALSLSALFPAIALSFARCLARIVLAGKYPNSIHAMTDETLVKLVVIKKRRERERESKETNRQNMMINSITMSLS